MGFRYVSADLLLADTAQLVALRHAESQSSMTYANVCLDHVLRLYDACSADGHGADDYDPNEYQHSMIESNVGTHWLPEEYKYTERGEYNSEKQITNTMKIIHTNA